MRFVNLSLLATGTVLRSELVHAADLEPAKLLACRALLSVEPTKSPLTVPGWEDLVVQQTLSEGVGFATIWQGSQVASSAILLAGIHPTAETELLELFYESSARMHAKVMPAASAASDAGPYVEFYIEDRRPAVFQVLWPALREAEYDRIEPIAVHFGAAFFQALGVERDAGSS